jgi:methylated-DNA-[protein]-cysteine S-methyltransferase
MAPWWYDPGTMTASGFALFTTTAGRCAIAWTERGVAGVQLPERDAPAMRARMVQRFPGATEAPPPADVQAAIDAIVSLLNGEPVALSFIALDMTGVQPFNRRVYEAARRIPAGQTITYGEVASRLRTPGAARAVGQALGRNPFPIVVPCPRVVAAGRAIGGFTAPGGADTKRRLLAIEGVHVEPARAVKRRATPVPAARSGHLNFG